MKKLMIGLVGAIAFAAGAEVSSGNVVGFNCNALSDNANLTAAMFDEIGADGMDIQKIIPNGDGMYGGAVTLKLLNSGLGDFKEYVYIPAEEAPDGETAGWYEDDFTTFVEKVFAPGEGFILMNGLEDSTRTISGEVKTGKPTWELGENANVTGNVTPTELDIQNICVGTAVAETGDLTDEGEEIYGGAITLKLLNSGLGDDIEFVYVPAVEAPDGETAGWYQDDFTTIADKGFASGEGFVLMNGLVSAWAQIPAVLTK